MPALGNTAERWLDEVVLFVTGTNDAGADFNLLYTLPAGLGDVAIIELEISATSLATMVADPEQLGVLAQILSADGATAVDILGFSRWAAISATTLVAYLSPDPLVLWRQAESLVIRGPELDTNVTPTGDITVRAKCVRVRPVEASIQPQPIRLVR